MESVDMKKLETAIIYLQRITEGNNPINNLPAEENSILNNPNVIRCMFFIKDILEKVKRNNGYIGRKAKRRDKLDFPLETLSTFFYEEDKSISKLVAQINKNIDSDVYKKVHSQIITHWLKMNEFLRDEYSQKLGKTITMPTEKGTQIGIRAEKRSNMRGFEYMLIIYGKNAQEYIVQNMKEILCCNTLTEDVSKE